jgi:hypothetical protein
MWTVDALILAFNVHFLYFYMFTSYGNVFALLTPIWYVVPWQNTRSQVLSTLRVKECETFKSPHRYSHSYGANCEYILVSQHCIL